MNGKFQFSAGTEVKDNVTLNIYISGCDGNTNCIREKCHNQELLDHNYGEKITIESVKEHLFKFPYDGVCILGGEPLDAEYKELEELLVFINNMGYKIALYTGYDVEQLESMKIFTMAKRFCDLIKYGNNTTEQRIIGGF